MILLENVDGETQRHRWYSIGIQPTLFGDVDVVTGRGSIGSKSSRTVVFRAKSIEEAQEKVSSLLKNQHQDGYREVRYET